MSKELDAALAAIEARENEKALLVKQMTKRFVELGFTNEELTVLFGRQIGGQ